MVRYGKAGCGTWLAADMVKRRYRKDRGRAETEIKKSVLPDVYMTLPAGEFTESKLSTVDYELEEENIQKEETQEETTQEETTDQSVDSPENDKEESKTDAGQTKSSVPVERRWLDQFAKVVELHQEGIEGDREAVKECHKLLKRIKLMAPENKLLKSYLGSALALLSMETLDPIERFNRATKYLKTLDRAISGEPDNIEIRALRAYVSFCLPEICLQRTATAVEDFNYLAARYEKDQSEFSQQFYWQVLYYLGEAYRRLEMKDEMLTVWDNLLSLKSDIKYSKMIQGKLSKTV